MSDREFCPGGDYAGCPWRGGQLTQKIKCERCGFEFFQEYLTPASAEAAREAARAEIARKENEEQKAREELVRKQADAEPAKAATRGENGHPEREPRGRKPESSNGKHSGEGSARGAAKTPKWLWGAVVLGLAAMATWAYQEKERRAVERYATLQHAKEESERRALQLQEEKANAERLAAELADAKKQSDRLKEEQEKMRRLFERNAAEREVDEQEQTRTSGNSFKDCRDCPEMVAIPTGSFLMGSPEGETKRYFNEGPQHRVSVAAFWVGKYEVTQGQWRAVMGSNPSKFKNCGDECPVEQVSSDDIQEFLKKLNANTGKQYRLPSEAEWEYAARAGMTTMTNWGSGADATCAYANVGDQALKNVHKEEWSLPVHNCNDGNAYTGAVGRYQPNAFGLYDMIGNVSELTQDCWNLRYSGAPSDGRAWTNGTCGQRVLRGNSWVSGPEDVRLTFRQWYLYDLRYSIGFRVALSAAGTLR